MATRPAAGASLRAGSRAGGRTAGLLSCGATPWAGRGVTQRLECESAHPVAHPTASLPAARPGGAGPCGRASDLSRPSQQGDPHTARVRCQEPEPYGICQAQRHEASDRQRGDGKHRATYGQFALERAAYFLVSRPCRGHTPVTVVLHSGSVEHVEMYGDFTPCSAGSLTGKMGTRPSPWGSWMLSFSLSLRKNAAARRARCALSNHCWTKSHRTCSGVLIQDHPILVRRIGKATNDVLRLLKLLFSHDPYTHRIRQILHGSAQTLHLCTLRHRACLDDQQVEVAVR
jgi:hypothetical protein